MKILIASIYANNSLCNYVGFTSYAEFRKWEAAYIREMENGGCILLKRTPEYLKFRDVCMTKTVRLRRVPVVVHGA